jgi:Amidases related to nicotinamidase
VGVVILKRALLVIDVQNEYFTGNMPVTYPAWSFNNILRAVDAANSKGILVVFIQHTAPQAGAKSFVKGSEGWELHRVLLNRKHACVIQKNLPGSFTGTGLENYLGINDIDTVTICGYMSHMCCDTTSRQAVHLGFSVEFLSDATGTLNLSNYAGRVTAKELHTAVLVTQAARFSKVISTDDWVHSL